MISKEFVFGLVCLSGLLVVITSVIGFYSQTYNCPDNFTLINTNCVIVNSTVLPAILDDKLYQTIYKPLITFFYISGIFFGLFMIYIVEYKKNPRIENEVISRSSSTVGV